MSECSRLSFTSKVFDDDDDRGYKTFSCSNQLSVKFILLINVHFNIY